MQRIDRTNAIVGAVYIALGGGFALASMQYDLGNSVRLGPGYFPFGIGLALAGAGIWVLLASLRSGVDVDVERWHLRPLVAIVASVVTFGLLISTAGLVVSIIGLVAVSSLAYSPFSWRTVGKLLLVLVPLTWIIFVVLLRLPMQVLPAFPTF